MLGKHALAKANKGVAQPTMAALRHARLPTQQQQQQQQSIDEMLQDPEDLEPQVNGERHRLLNGGLQNGGLHSGPAR
jgi:hypothetical protein